MLVRDTLANLLENGFDTVERLRCIEASTPVRAIAKAENSIPQRLEDVDKVGKSKVKAVKLDSAFVILAGASPTASVAAVRFSRMNSVLSFHDPAR